MASAVPVFVCWKVHREVKVAAEALPNMGDFLHYRGLSLTRAPRKPAPTPAVAIRDTVEIHPRHIGKMDRYREQLAGMQQHFPTDAERMRQANDMRPMTSEQIESMNRGMQNTYGVEEKHVHEFCSWLKDAVVFPDGKQLAFPCICGAVMAHTADGRAFVDYTKAVKPA